MKAFLRRREFLTVSALSLFGILLSKQAKAGPPPIKITEKDIMVEGKTTAVADYCENAAKQPNKFCPKAVAGTSCAICQFYTNTAEVTFKGKKYAKCQIVPNAPNYACSTGVCATYVKRNG